MLWRARRLIWMIRELQAVANGAAAEGDRFRDANNPKVKWRQGRFRGRCHVAASRRHIKKPSAISRSSCFEGMVPSVGRIGRGRMTD